MSDQLAVIAPNTVQTWSRFANTVEDIERIGRWIETSGMMKVSRPGSGTTVALTCILEGKTPIEFFRTYHIMTDGMLSKKATAMDAEFRLAGGKVKWLETGEGDFPDESKRRAKAIFTLGDESVEMSYSMADAKRAKLWNLDKPDSNWNKSPADMLRARVKSKGISLLAPWIVAGDMVGDEPDPVSVQVSNPPPPLFGGFPSEPVKEPETKPRAKAKVKSEPVDAEIVQKPKEDDIPMSFETAAPVVQEPPKQEPEKIPEIKPVTPEAIPTPLSTIPLQMQKDLVRVIGPERLDEALEFMWAKGWCPRGNAMAFMVQRRAEAILRNPPAFLALLDDVKKAATAAS